LKRGMIALRKLDPECFGSGFHHIDGLRMAF
jgi:hypothetical protein